MINALSGRKQPKDTNKKKPDKKSLNGARSVINPLDPACRYSGINTFDYNPACRYSGMNVVLRRGQSQASY